MSHEDIPISTTLNLPHCGIVQTYGGGDENKVGQLIYKKYIYTPHRNTDIMTDFKKKIYKLAKKTWRSYSKIALNDRVVSVPNEFPLMDDIEWDVVFVVSAGIKDVEHYNMMFQGWLFNKEVQEPNRLGVSSWPFIGVFDPVNIFIKSENDQYMGIEKLVPADQHTHFVTETVNLDGFDVELGDWHFGSDMARFYTDKEIPIAGGWVVIFDCERKKCGIEYLIVLENQDIKKTLLKESTNNIETFVNKLMTLIEEVTMEDKNIIIENLKKVIQKE